MPTIQNLLCVSIDAERRLHNILRQEILNNDTSMDLMNVFEIGEKREKQFDTIHRNKLQTLYACHGKQKMKTLPKHCASSRSDRLRSC